MVPSERPAAPDWRAAVACVAAMGPNGPVRGTAFLIDAQFAMTALHVVANRHSVPIEPYFGIELSFIGPNHHHVCAAEWIPEAADAHADWALLRLLTPLPPGLAEPLLLEELLAEDLEQREVSWRSLGFPDAKPDGIEVGGVVRSTSGSVNGCAALQLFSQEAAAGAGAPVSGLSGAPVIVDGAVAGLLRWATLDAAGQSVAGTLYACPTATIRAGLARLSNLSIAKSLRDRPCPYPGLVAFAREQASLFFGRNAEIDFLLRHLEKQHFLLVIGPSGSGKSSLVQAGLLAQLLPGLCAHTLRPGTDPVRALDELLGPNDQLLTTTAAKKQRVLLFIDQLEELFVYPPRAQQHAFCKRLQALRSDARCILILGLRADFFPDLMGSELWPVDPGQRLEVAPLRGQALLAAIAEPAARVGVQLELALQERLLADAADEPGVLPLLQETLVLLWRRRSGRRLTLAAYQSLGDTVTVWGGNASKHRSGLGVAIATHAESVLAELSIAQRRLARRIFLRLVLFGEGRANTRRQQALLALRAPEDDAALFDDVMRRLIEARLLTASAPLAVAQVGASLSAMQPQGGPEGPPLIDLAHEVLLLAWPRLSSWIDELRQAERTRRRLEDYAIEWQRLRQQGGGLLDAVEVREALDWLKSPDAQELGSSGEVRALIGASQEAQEQQEAERQAVLKREAEQEMALLRERARAQTRLWRAVTAVLAVAVCASGSLALWALRERRRAQHESAVAAAKARVATGRHLAVQARSQIGSSLDSALLLAVAAERIDSGPDTQGALLETLQHLPWLSRIVRTAERSVRAASAEKALSPDGKLQALGGQDSKVRLFDAQSGRPVSRPLEGHDNKVRAVAFSFDGRILASGSDDKSVRLWRVENGQPIGKLVRAEAFEVLDSSEWTDGNPLGVVAVQFSPDGKLLIAGMRDGSLQLWNLTTQSPLGPLLRGSQSAPLQVGFSENGSEIQSVHEDGMTLHLAVSGEPALQIARYVAPTALTAVATSSSGRYLAIGGESSTLLLFEVQSTSGLGPTLALSTPRPLVGPHGTISSLAFSPDGQFLVSANHDQTLQLWRIPEGTRIGEPLRGHTKEVSSVAFSADGKMLASGGWDDTVRRWNTSDGKPLGEALQGHDGPVTCVAWSPNGAFLISGGLDRTLQMWNARTGLPLEKPLFAHEQSLSTCIFSPDGRFFLTGGEDQTVRQWETSNRQPIGFPWNGTRGRPAALAFRPDGHWVVAASEDGHLQLWDVPTATALASGLYGHSAAATGVAFSADGRWLASVGRDHNLRVWSTDPLARQTGWVAQACKLAGRDLFPDERRRFHVPLTLSVCPQ